MKELNYIKKTFSNPIQESYSQFFQKVGIPGRKNEDYRFSSIPKWFRNDWNFNKAKRESLKDSNFLNIEVGLNGEITSSELEFQETNFDHLANLTQDPLKSLGLSSLDKVYSIKLKGSQKIKITYTCEQQSYLSSLICFESSGKNIILEDFSHIEGERLIQTSLKIDIKNGKLDYFRIDQNNISNAHFSYPYFNLLSEDSVLNINQMVLGECSQRFDPEIKIQSEKAIVNFNTFYYLEGDSHFEINSKISHLAKECYSNQKVIGILKDKAKMTFTGRIFIDHDCQGVEGNQFNKNIVIGDQAQALSQPQLEIFNDDVKCAHGSTTGQISSDELFYLQSRGISKQKAAQMIMGSFAEVFLSEIDDDYIQKMFKGKYQSFLKGTSL